MVTEAAYLHYVDRQSLNLLAFAPAFAFAPSPCRDDLLIAPHCSTFGNRKQQHPVPTVRNSTLQPHFATVRRSEGASQRIQRIGYAAIGWGELQVYCGSTAMAHAGGSAGVHRTLIGPHDMVASFAILCIVTQCKRIHCTAGFTNVLATRISDELGGGARCEHATRRLL